MYSEVQFIDRLVFWFDQGNSALKDQKVRFCLIRFGNQEGFAEHERSSKLLYLEIISAIRLVT